MSTGEPALAQASVWVRLPQKHFRKFNLTSLGCRTLHALVSVVQGKEREFWNSAWLKSCLSDLWLGDLPSVVLSFLVCKMEEQQSLCYLTVRWIEWSH